MGWRGCRRGSSGGKGVRRQRAWRPCSGTRTHGAESERKRAESERERQREGRERLRIDTGRRGAGACVGNGRGELT